MEGPNSKTNFFQVYQSESNISGMNRWSKSTQNEDQEQQDTLFHIESDEFLVAAKALAKFDQVIFLFYLFFIRNVKRSIK